MAKDTVRELTLPEQIAAIAQDIRSVALSTNTKLGQTNAFLFNDPPAAFSDDKAQPPAGFLEDHRAALNEIAALIDSIRNQVVYQHEKFGLFTPQVGAPGSERLVPRPDLWEKTLTEGLGGSLNADR